VYDAIEGPANTAATSTSRSEQAATRRSLLRQIGIGGAATLTAVASGVGGRALARERTQATALPGNSRPTGNTVAQAQGTTVTLPLAMTVRQGPSAGLHLEGILALLISDSGAIDRGVFVPIQDGQPGDPISVVGQITGRAVNLLFQLPAGPVFGIGTSIDDLRMAAGLFDPNTGKMNQPFPLGGSFVGPQDGDQGDWFLFIFIAPIVIAGVVVGCVVANQILANSC
jgi:hypothetical protein